MPGWYALYALNKVRTGRRLGFFDVMMLKRSRKKPKLTAADKKPIIPERDVQELRRRFGDRVVDSALSKGPSALAGLYEKAKMRMPMEIEMATKGKIQRRFWGKRRAGKATENVGKATEEPLDEMYLREGTRIWKAYEEDFKEIPKIPDEVEPELFLMGALNTMPPEERERFAEEEARLQEVGVTVFDILDFVERIDTETERELGSGRDALPKKLGMVKRDFENLDILAKEGFFGIKGWLTLPREQREKVAGAFRGAIETVEKLEAAGLKREEWEGIIHRIVNEANKYKFIEGVGKLMGAVSDSILLLKEKPDKAEEFAMACIHEKKDTKRDEMLIERLKLISKKRQKRLEELAEEMRDNLG